MGLMAAVMRALHAALFIAIHVALASLFIWAIWLVQTFLTETGDPKLFNVMPLRFVFDTMDVGIAIAFLVLAALEMRIVYQESYRPILMGAASEGQMNSFLGCLLCVVLQSAGAYIIVALFCALMAVLVAAFIAWPLGMSIFSGGVIVGLAVCWLTVRGASKLAALPRALRELHMSARGA